MLTINNLAYIKTMTSEIVTPYLCAFFSQDVYKQPSESLPRNWRVFRSSDKDIHGYFARAYINSDSIIIAHRGTDNDEGIKSDEQMINGMLPDQLLSAKTFINTIMDLAKQHTYTFTGHSLGGALAIFSSATYGMPAIAFDTPGVEQIISNHTLDFPYIVYAQNNVVAYNTANNIINSAGYQMGTVYRLYPPVDELCNLPDTPQPSHVFFTAPFSFHVGGIVQSADQFGLVFDRNLVDITNQHSIEGIVAQFNNITGQAFVSSLQTPWARNGYEQYASFDVNPYYWQCYLTSSFSRQTLDNPRFEFLTSYQLQTFGVDQKPTIGHGVNIVGDDYGNTIWGTTNFADTVETGLGNDVIYLYQGDDKVTDKGGDDKYLIPYTGEYIKTINDLDGKGEILIGNTLNSSVRITQVTAISKSACKSMSNMGNGQIYMFYNVSIGTYYLIKQNEDLIITHDCPRSSQPPKNMIKLLKFTWGDFGIEPFEKPTLSFTSSIFQSVLNFIQNWLPLTQKTDEIYFCTKTFINSSKNADLVCIPNVNNEKKCICLSGYGDDTLRATIGKNSILIGNAVGSKTFKLIDPIENNPYEHFVQISKVKAGDRIELPINVDSNQINLLTTPSEGGACTLIVREGDIIAKVCTLPGASLHASWLTENSPNIIEFQPVVPEEVKQGDQILQTNSLYLPGEEQLQNLYHCIQNGDIACTDTHLGLMEKVKIAVLYTQTKINISSDNLLDAAKFCGEVLTMTYTCSILGIGPLGFGLCMTIGFSLDLGDPVLVA